MRETRANKARREARREAVNLFLTVLLTLAMVLQSSPFAYADVTDDGTVDEVAAAQAEPETLAQSEAVDAEDELVSDEVQLLSESGGDEVEFQVINEENDTSVGEEKSDEQAAPVEESKSADVNEFTYSDDDIKVTATLEKAGAIPSDAKLMVKQVTAESAKDSTYVYAFDAYMGALNKDAGATDEEPAFSELNTLLYDVAFITTDADGKVTEHQPSEGSVKVKFEFKNKQLDDYLEVEKAADVKVVHLPVKDAKKASTTYATTNITADDVKVENVAAADITAEGTSAIEITLRDFSIIAVANPEKDAVEEVEVPAVVKSAPAKAASYNEGVQRTHTNTDTTSSGVSYTWEVGWTTGADGSTMEYWDNPETYEYSSNVGERMLIHKNDWTYARTVLTFRVQVNKDAQTTEDQTIPAGAVRLVLPRYIFKDWNGAGTGAIETDIKETSDGTNMFVLSYEDDNIVITNVQPIGARGAAGNITYKVDPLRVNGGHPIDNAHDNSRASNKWWIYDNEFAYTAYYTNDFPFTFELKEDSGATEPDESSTGLLGVDLLTRSVGKFAGGLMPTDTTASGLSEGTYLVWQDAWGTKPADADDYFYVVWGLMYGRYSAQTLSNQPWTTTVMADELSVNNKAYITTEDGVNHVIGKGEVIGRLQSGEPVGSVWYQFGEDNCYLSKWESTLRGLYNNQEEGTSRTVYPNGYIANRNPSYYTIDNVPAAADYTSGRHYAFLMRYPKSMFETALNEYGIDMYDGEDVIKVKSEFIAKEHWDSDYDREQRIVLGEAEISLLQSEPGGEFIKVRSNWTNVKGAQTFLTSGNGMETLLAPEIGSTGSWTIYYNGTAAIEMDQETQQFVSRGQKLTITEPSDSALHLNSSTATKATTWAASDIVAVDENNYNLRYFYPTFTEYDVSTSGNLWQINSAPNTNYADEYAGATVYVRLRGETEFTEYATITRTSSGGYTAKKADGSSLASHSSYGWVLPENCVQIKVEHDSEHARCNFALKIMASLLPTGQVRSIVQNHMDNGATTYVTNAASYETEPLSDEFINPALEERAHRQGTNYSAKGSTQYNFLRLTKINPTMRVSKDSYWPARTTADQKAAKEKGKQVNYVLLKARVVPGFETVDAKNNPEIAEPYKPLTGTFYELLPEGVSVDTSTIVGFYDMYHQNAYHGGSGSRQLIEVRDYNYWKTYNPGANNRNRLKMNASEFQVDFQEDAATGQTMMIIHYDVTARAANLIPVTSEWQVNVVFLFKMENTITNIRMHLMADGANPQGGLSTLNALGYVNETPDAYTPNSTTPATTGEKEPAYTSVEEEAINNGWFTGYTTHDIDWADPEYVEWGINKLVTTTDYLDGVPVDVGQYSKDQTVATLGNDYTYSLNYGVDERTRAANIIMYDILETGTPNNTTAWQGTFKELDVSAIKNMKNAEDTEANCDPVVYYSTTLSSVMTQANADLDLTNGSWIVWDESNPPDTATVKAIAIDCRTDTKGNKFVLGEKQELFAYVTMTAPVEYQEGKAANGLVVESSQFNQGEPIPEATDKLMSPSSVSLRDISVMLTKDSDPMTGVDEDGDGTVSDEERTQVKPDGNGTITYRLTLRNDSVYDVDNVIVTDPIPEGLTIKTVKVNLNNSGTETTVYDADDSSVSGDAQRGFLCEITDERDCQFTINRQYVTTYVTDEDGTIQTDDDGNKVVDDNKDTYIYITCAVDSLYSDANDGKQVDARNYDNTATLVSANGKVYDEDTDTMYHRAETTTVPVEKVWENVEEGDEPEKVTVTVTGEASYEKTTDDGTETVSGTWPEEGTKTADITADDNWAIEVGDLPLYFVDDTDTDYDKPTAWAEWAWDVEEDPIEGYESVKMVKLSDGAWVEAEDATEEQLAGDVTGFRFINAKLKTMTVDKKWLDIFGGDDDWPEGVSILMWLTADGDRVPLKFTILDSTHTSYTWDSLPFYKKVDGVRTEIEYSVDELVILKGEESVSYYEKTKTVDDGTAVTWTNKYTAKGEGLIEAEKVLENREWTDDDSFEFTLAAGAATYDNNETSTSPMPAPGGEKVTITKDDKNSEGLYKKAFGDIEYTLPGTYEYTIKETKGSLGGVHYDIRTLDVTVTVTDNGDGTLTATTDYGEGNVSAEFTNTYEATGKLELTANKSMTFEGEEYWPSQTTSFTFEITGGDDSHKYANGTATESAPTANFGTVTFNHNSDKSDLGKTFTYTVKEAVPAGATQNDDGTYTYKGVTYDDTEHTVEVTVTDDGAGTLVPHVKVDGKEVTLGEDKSGNENADDPGIPVAEVGTFANTYEMEGKADPAAVKVLEGRDWTTEDSFTFTIEADGSNPAGASIVDPVEVTITSEDALDGDEVISEKHFGPITFTRPGTYKYNVTETVEEEDGVSYDLGTHVVEYTATDNGDGTMKVEAKLDGEAFDSTDGVVKVGPFTNTFTPATASITLKKVFEDWDKAGADDFEFTLTAGTATYADGTTGTSPMPKSGKVDDGPEPPVYYGDGSEGEGSGDAATTTAVATEDAPTADFGEIEFVKAGTYEYTIAEVDGHADGVNYDAVENDEGAFVPDTHTVRVVVTKGEKPTNTLTATVKYDDDLDELEIINTFTPVTAELEATKDINVWGEESEFTFELTPVDGSPMPGDAESVTCVATVDAPTVNFGQMTYEKAGEYKYIVREIPGNKDYVTYDGSDHEVTVVVTKADDATNALSAEVLYESEDGLTITNVYDAEGEVALEAKKVMKGAKLKAGQFEFELVDAEGNVVQTKSNAADGTVAFDAIEFLLGDAGTSYAYTVREVIPAGAKLQKDGSYKKGNYTYDGHVDTVKVLVTDNGDGTLTCEATYDSDGATFTNTYTPPKVPQTGDLARRGVAGALGMGCGLLAVGLWLRRRREEDAEA